LRQHLSLDGLPVNLLDTAGLRRACDAAEEEGIRRARQEMRRADRILYVIDASLADDRSADRIAEHAIARDELPADVPVCLVFNKIDLAGIVPHAEQAPARIFVSAWTGAGIDLLRADLKESAGYRGSESGSGAFAARRRHLEALERSRALVESAAQALKDSAGIELFAEDLRLAPVCARRDHRRGDQRGSARGDFRELLYRQVSLPRSPRIQ